MSKTLTAHSPQESETATKRGKFDSHYLENCPYLVIARLAIEWARIDNNAGIRGWGHEHWGQPITIDSDVWAIGYRGVPGGAPVLTVTIKGNEYGGGPKYQRTWYIEAATMRWGLLIPTANCVVER